MEPLPSFALSYQCVLNTKEDLIPLEPKQLEVVLEYKEPKAARNKAGNSKTKNEPALDDGIEMSMFEEEKHEEQQETNAILIEMGWKINRIPYLSKGMLDSRNCADSKRRRI
jgi:hypothetical protein